MSLQRLFLSTASVNTLTAAINLLSTVLLVRWFGASAYANYLVDLSYISILLILLEIVPSNYSVFRVQDDPTKINGLAALAIATAFILICIAFVSGSLFGLFHANSFWIAPYAGSMAIKRYLDIRLQSAGRLREYFGIELFGAILRIGLMIVFLWCAVQSADAIWASLACATFLTQGSWFGKNPEEFKNFSSFFSRSTWSPLIAERRAYLPYYFGIAVKRVRDNLVPILASSFFINRETLGSFFLVYRGLLFTLGQLRVIEGMLNHRQTLIALDELSFLKRVVVSILGQVICISASCLLIIFSGVEKIQITTITILSFIVVFSNFSILARARAYSNFDMVPINLSMVVHCLVLTGFVFLLISFNIRSENAFSSILLVTEIAAMLTIYKFKKK